MMQMLMQWLCRSVHNEKGALGIEYAVLVAFIALAFIVGATALGTNLNTWFNNLSTAVSGWASS